MTVEEILVERIRELESAARDVLGAVDAGALFIEGSPVTLEGALEHLRGLVMPEEWDDGTAAD